MKTYDIIVYIGRFQPLHKAHIKNITFAQHHAKNTVVLIGSGNASRSPKNPFSFEERENFIRTSVADDFDLEILSIPDLYPDSRWVHNVLSLIHI